MKLTGAPYEQRQVRVTIPWLLTLCVACLSAGYMLAIPFPAPLLAPPSSVGGPPLPPEVAVGSTL